MTHNKPIDAAAIPTRLAEAHELMPRLMPELDAPVAEWVAFRRRSAAIYTRVADTDRGHHHEAPYWAQLEREEAETLAARLAHPPGADVTTFSAEAKEEQCPQKL